MRQVALLRGINVGGKNHLAMKDLVAICTAAGCTDVATYAQSGNVVLSSSTDPARAIESAIARRHGLRVPVVTRTQRELAEVVRAHPFADDEEHLHVMFLADAPSATLVRALDPQRSPGDRFEVHGRELFLHLPNGVARTKLSNAYVDATLATVSTQRTWRTVLALHELVRGAPAPPRRARSTR